MNVWCIPVVNMATAMWRGNVHATGIGVAFYAIKVSCFVVVYLIFIKFSNKLICGLSGLSYL